MPWPAIDGIDSADARDRWCGDARLFSAMLERLLGEFFDVDLPGAAGDSGSRQGHIRRMHRLRGGACMLGAKTVSKLAGEVEAAYVAGEVERATGLTARLNEELRRVRHSAGPVCLAARADTEDAATASAELEPHAIVELERLLRQQSLSANERFRALSPQLRRIMGSVRYDRMRGQVDNLEFDDAADELMKGRGGAR
jgi:HPt (histidine-containing phosphotransfer) domain-containing protein